jgi:hypothetical protein
MAQPDFPRSIVEFQQRFADEADCLDYLAWSRWPDGFRCPACGGRRAWVLARRHLWECTACGRQTSVTAGTVMDHTHTPLRLWLWSAYLVATHTPGISAKQLQRQLGIGRYETAWFILQKLRRAMIAPERGLLDESGYRTEADGALLLTGRRHINLNLAGMPRQTVQRTRVAEHPPHGEVTQK